MLIDDEDDIGVAPLLAMFAAPLVGVAKKAAGKVLKATAGKVLGKITGGGNKPPPPPCSFFQRLSKVFGGRPPCS